MQVKIYDCSHGIETLRCQCDLQDCFPDESQDLDYHRALWELKRSGRVWCGGGAAPLVILMAVREG